jgi:hypothetical protein
MFIFAAFYWRRGLMLPRETSAITMNLFPRLSPAHFLSFRDKKTALALSTERNKVDVAAYLHSAGAPQ